MRPQHARRSAEAWGRLAKELIYAYIKGPKTRSVQLMSTYLEAIKAYAKTAFHFARVVVEEEEAEARRREEWMNWKAEVKVNGCTEWVGNGIVFETRIEASQYTAHVAECWTAVKDARVRPTDDRVTHRFVNGKLIEIAKVV